jgi:hypothetical protein
LEALTAHFPLITPLLRLKFLVNVAASLNIISSFGIRIPVHVQKIIACDGNNLHQEGRKKGYEKLRIHWKLKLIK